MKRKPLSNFLISFLVILIPYFYGVGPVFSKNYSEDEQMILVGVGSLRDGLYDVAEKQFQQFVKDYPNHKRIYEATYLLGKTFILRGKWKEARNVFARVVNQDKTFENMDYALFWLAESERRAGNGEEARRLFLSLVKRYPKFDWLDYATFLTGMIDFEANRLTAGENSFKTVSQTSRRPELAQSALFWLGLASFRRSDYEGAVGTLQTLLKDPKHLPPDSLRAGLFTLGEAYVRLGKFEEAISSYRSYEDRYRKDPLLPHVSWRIIFCQYRRGDIKGALDALLSFENQMKQTKLGCFASYLAAEILMKQGDYNASIKEFISILDSSQGRSLWGISLIGQFWNCIQLGLTEESNKIFQRLIKLDHFEEEKMMIQWLNAEIMLNEGKIIDSLPYYFNIMNSRFREKTLLQIGKGYFFESKFREAITNLDILFLEFPTSRYLEEGLFLKGECLLQMGDREKALEVFVRMTALKSSEAWTRLALTEMGHLFLKKGLYDQAQRSFQTVFHMPANHPLFYHAALQLGNIEFKNKKMIEAISYYSTVLKGNITDLQGETHFRLGEIFYGQEKHDKALTSFEAALAYFKENSTWFFLTQLETGNLHARQDNNGEARKSYKNILDHAKDEDIKKAARDLLSRIESN